MKFVLPDTDSNLIVLQWDQQENESQELYLAGGYSIVAQKQSSEAYQPARGHKAA
jgi:hypothetical protein